ncbi:MAG: hypothetical protein J0M09_07910 [Xanthomonadales bacterium]|nr:hypothetical protein [Xanthomonadales bacterium]
MPRPMSRVRSASLEHHGIGRENAMTRFDAIRTNGSRPCFADSRRECMTRTLDRFCIGQYAGCIVQSRIALRFAIYVCI